MIYDGVLEVNYKQSEGLTNITAVYPDIKVSLWCNWSIDIIVVDSDNLNQKNTFIEHLEEFLGENMLLASSSETSPIVVRPCNCPSSSISTILPEYDSLHISPIVYEKNKEILHVMLASESTDKLFDKIKSLLDFKPRYGISNAILEIIDAFNSKFIMDPNSPQYYNYRIWD